MMRRRGVPPMVVTCVLKKKKKNEGSTFGYMLDNIVGTHGNPMNNGGSI